MSRWAGRISAVGRFAAIPERVVVAEGRRRLSWRRLQRAITDACRGLAAAWRGEPNLRLHVVAGAIVFAGGVSLRFSQHEWLALTLAMGLVMFAELVNTVIERTVDLVVGLAPDPLARHIKDLAAASVLLAALIATVVGLLVLGPRLLVLVRSR